MSEADQRFYIFALIVLMGALSSALRHDLRRAVRSLLAAGAGVSGLLALLGGPLVAAPLAALVVAASVVMWRLAPGGPGEDGRAVRRDGVTVPAGAGEDAADVGYDGTSPPIGRVPAALLVLAFFVIALRVVLMARWPLLAATRVAPSAADVPAMPAVSWFPPVSLPHYFVTALALFCIGLFAATTRRGAAGVGIGATLLYAAVTVVLVAAAHFVNGAGDTTLLAVLAIVLATVLSTGVALAGSPSSDPPHDSVAARRVGTGIFMVLSAVTLALLAGAW